jgi:hypothetical protein
MADSLHSSSRNVLQWSAVPCFARSKSATLHAVRSAWLENTGRAKAENRGSMNSQTNCALPVLARPFLAHSACSFTVPTSGTQPLRARAGLRIGDLRKLKVESIAHRTALAAQLTKLT